MNIIYIATIFVLASSLLFFVIKFFALKKSNLIKIEELDHQIDEEKKNNNRLISELNELKKVDKSQELKLLIEQLDKNQKEKEAEINLRNEAEKQIILTIQKTEDLEKRMNDWKIAQDSAMQDALNTINKVGEVLYQKISFDQAKTHQLTSEINNKIANFAKNISENNSEILPKSQSHLNENLSRNIQNQPNYQQNQSKKIDQLIDLNLKLKNALASSKLKMKEEYFIKDFFAEKFAKLFYCDIALSHDSQMYFFDLKSCAIFSDFKSSRDDEKQSEILISKINKYCEYLVNPKYFKAISTAIKSINPSFDNAEIVMVVNDESDIDWMNKNDISEKLDHLNIKVATFAEFIELTH